MKIEVNNLTKRFKKNTVVDNVSISFESGKIYGLIGRNGSGKSVFLKMLCAFYTPTDGYILQDSENYIKMGDFPKNTGALIEGPDFLPDLTGMQNLQLLAGIQKKITDEQILEILEKVNLISEKDKKYGDYSLGMKQKLGIAQALMENPEFIILDEPFNGIEESSVKIIKEIIKEERAKGKLIIVTSHIREDIEELADEIYSFDLGKIRKIR